MSYRFKEPGHGMGPHSGPSDGMRPMGPNDSKFDDRMMGGMDGDKMPRDDTDGDSRGPRPPFGRGRRLSPPRDKPMGDRQRDFGYGRDDMPPHGRDRSPIRGGFDDRFQDRFKRDEMSFPRRERDGRGRDMPLGDDMYRDKFVDSRSRFDRPSGMNSRFEPPDDLLRHQPLHYQNAQYKGNYFKNDVMKPNECEIIVVNKLQRAYAENVENRMKNLGIQVDLLFLKDEALLVQTIDDIARRGSLYAIVISPLNETHRSVTLNILCGTPQEHRNMPLDDALKLIARNFHDHIRNQRELMERDKSERGAYSGTLPADREIQFLLRLLADGRQVSLGELETVLKFLNERKDKMKGLSGDRTPATVTTSNPPEIKISPQKPKDENEIAQKEQNLQNRIMNIMSQEETGGDVAMSSPSKSSAPGNSVPGFGPDVSGRRPEGGTAPNLRGPAPNEAMRAAQNRSGMGMNRPGMPPNMSGTGPNQPNMSSMAGSGNQPGSNQPPMGAGVPSSGSSQASTTSTYINFDNPSVKKALDSLMQSGPNLLKSLSSTTSAPPQNNPTNKMAPTAMGGGMGPQRGSGGIGDMGQQRGPGGMNEMGQHRGAGGMGDIGPQRGSGGMGDMGPQRGPMGDMVSQRGPGGMGDMGPQRGPGSMGDMVPQRGPGGMGDMGPQRGPGGMGDMGSQRGPGGMGDMGSQRGPGSMGDMGPQRGPGGMGDMGPQRGPGGMGDMGMRGGMGDMGSRGGADMGAKRGLGSMGDMGPPRGMGDMGMQRGLGGMGDMGPRGSSGMDDMGPQRGQGGMGGMGNMGPQRGSGNMGMQRGPMGDGNMGPGMGDSGGMGGRPGPNMGPGPRSGGMGPGSQFQGPQGMFGGGPNMMGNRPPYMGGHGSGMGGGPRRY